MESNASTTSSTATPRVPLGPRPTPPSQKLTARPVAHDLDWDHIPTAVSAPVHLTREQLDREIAAAKAHEPYLIGYGGIQAHAF